MSIDFYRTLNRFPVLVKGNYWLLSIEEWNFVLKMHYYLLGNANWQGRNHPMAKKRDPFALTYSIHNDVRMKLHMRVLME